ncbi:MAG: S9 family peptidase [Woeseiaceae bacterium]|nr:S9 family peptidase [Woeseiaceae bacterium]
MPKKFLVLVLLLAGSAAGEELPIEHFGHLPMVSMPTVTPSGSHVAAILHGDEGPTIVVGEFGSRDLTAIVKLKYGEDRIEWIDWANEDRLLISVSEPMRRPTEIFGSRQPYQEDRIRRLYQVRRDGSDMKQIRRKEPGFQRPQDEFISTDTVMSMLPDDPDHILMQLWDSRDRALAVFKVNLEKNSFDKQFANTYDVNWWYANDAGEVVLGIEWFQNVLTTWYRPDGGKDWEVLDERNVFDETSFSVISIDGDDAIVLSDRETGYESAWRYDLASGEFGELIFAADGHDISGAIMSSDRNRVIGFSWVDHYRQDHYIEPDDAGVYRTVTSSFPGYSTYIASASEDMQKLIVVAQRDDAPPKYIWMDLSVPTAGAWYAAYPYLEGKPLAKKTPIAFEAPDELEIEGYLTLPPEPDGERPSLVLFPHGGPWARDTQNFDPWVQFMANRGHAVLQVNFRGSAGFGTAFERAGYKQFGLAMQEDLYAAVDWLAEQDLVDTDRACIVGFSYGGYAALTAAFQRPGLFDCVASFAGIADLHEMVRIESLSTSRKLVMAEMIGDIGDSGDSQMLKDMSATNHVGRIRAPVLMIHGTQDTRVYVEQSRDFVSRARAAGVDIEYIEIEDGTHFLDEHHNRVTVFRALDAFLDEHL